jgi:hypothetical protein
VGIRFVHRRLSRSRLDASTISPRVSCERDAPGPHGSPGDAKHRPETAHSRLLTMRVWHRATRNRLILRSALRARLEGCTAQRTTTRLLVFAARDARILRNRGPGRRLAPIVRVRQKSTRQNHRFRQIRPAFRAQWFYRLYVIPGETGRCCHRCLVSSRKAQHLHRGAGTTRLRRPCHVVRRTTQRVHRIPLPTFVTIAKRPLWLRDARMIVLICPTRQHPSGCDRLARRANSDAMLFRETLLAFLLRCSRSSRLSSCLRCFPGFPQGAKSFHVLANGNGFPLDIRHCLRTLFQGETLPVGPLDPFGRRFSGLFGGHLPIPICNRIRPAQSEDRAGNGAISVHP